MLPLASPSLKSRLTNREPMKNSSLCLCMIVSRDRLTFELPRSVSNVYSSSTVGLLSDIIWWRSWTLAYFRTWEIQPIKCYSTQEAKPNINIYWVNLSELSLKLVSSSLEPMFPLIFSGRHGEKFPCAVFMNFGENLGSNVRSTFFFAFRDFKKPNYICLCLSRMKWQFFINRLCLISTFKL